MPQSPPTLRAESPAASFRFAGPGSAATPALRHSGTPEERFLDTWRLFRCKCEAKGRHALLAATPGIEISGAVQEPDDPDFVGMNLIEEAVPKDEDLA